MFNTSFFYFNVHHTFDTVHSAQGTIEYSKYTYKIAELIQIVELALCKK